MTPEEHAREILGPELASNKDFNTLLRLIAAKIREYSDDLEQRTKNLQETLYQTDFKIQEGRRETIEECARIADSFYEDKNSVTTERGKLSYLIAQAIRALLKEEKLR